MEITRSHAAIIK
uniref:Uncharacterized protein n=1 Tax=Rhizophora mucronata TaxID=61149 RepID=A0A2P2IIZ9_RHIMU